MYIATNYPPNSSSSLCIQPDIYNIILKVLASWLDLPNAVCNNVRFKLSGGISEIFSKLTLGLQPVSRFAFMADI